MVHRITGAHRSRRNFRQIDRSAAGRSETRKIVLVGHSMRTPVILKICAPLSRQRRSDGRCGRRLHLSGGPNAPDPDRMKGPEGLKTSEALIRGHVWQIRHACDSGAQTQTFHVRCRNPPQYGLSYVCARRTTGPAWNDLANRYLVRARRGDVASETTPCVLRRYALGERIRHEVTSSCRTIVLHHTFESNAMSHKILPLFSPYEVPLTSSSVSTVAIIRGRS
jgi:hypothetical protein